jgi:hypothetical protein
VSPDGRWLATAETTPVPQPAVPLCLAPLGGDRVPLATAASPSGRYVAWYSGGAAWRPTSRQASRRA